MPPAEEVLVPTQDHRKLKLDPMTIISLVSILAKNGPEWYDHAVQLLGMKEATLEDVINLRKKITSKSYDDYIKG